MMARIARISSVAIIIFLVALPAYAGGSTNETNWLLVSQTIALKKPVYFADIDGGSVLVPIGIYSVEPDDNHLLLIPLGGEVYYDIIAEREESTEAVSHPLAISIPDDEDDPDVYLIVYKSIDGQQLVAEGSYSGVRTRGARGKLKNKLKRNTRVGRAIQKRQDEKAREKRAMDEGAKLNQSWFDSDWTDAATGDGWDRLDRPRFKDGLREPFIYDSGGSNAKVILAQSPGTFEIAPAKIQFYNPERVNQIDDLKIRPYRPWRANRQNDTFLAVKKDDIRKMRISAYVSRLRGKRSQTFEWVSVPFGSDEDVVGNLSLDLEAKGELVSYGAGSESSLLLITYLEFENNDGEWVEEISRTEDWYVEAVEFEIAEITYKNVSFMLSGWKGHEYIESPEGAIQFNLDDFQFKKDKNYRIRVEVRASTNVGFKVLGFLSGPPYWVAAKALVARADFFAFDRNQPSDKGINWVNLVIDELQNN